MAKIDKIQVGATSYDINLPDNSTLNGLTVTGTLTAPNISGTTITATTANLSVVNSFLTRAGTTAYFDTIYPNTISFGAQTLTLTGSSLNINAYNVGLSVPTISLNGQEVDLNYSHINAGNATSEIWFNGKLYLNDKEMNAVSIIENSDDTVTLSITNF